jgi:hypothetical protein
MYRFVVACAISCVMSPDIARAQTPINIQDNWVAKTAECGDLNLNEARLFDVGAADAEHRRKDVSALATIASTLTGCVGSNWPADRIRT